MPLPNHGLCERVLYTSGAPAGQRLWNALRKSGEIAFKNTLKRLPDGLAPVWAEQVRRHRVCAVVNAVGADTLQFDAHCLHGARQAAKANSAIDPIHASLLPVVEIADADELAKAWGQPVAKFIPPNP